MASAAQNGNSPKQPVVCVFCGSSEGTSPVHVQAARDLAHSFHKHGIKLVYGGGTVGIMGEVAKTLVSLSGPDSVHGIIPTALLRFERNYIENGAEADPKSVIDEETFGRMTDVETMHVRKQMMADEVTQGGPGSGFVALSGGYGTLEEIIEMTTWNQLGIHSSPCVLYNVDGFWDAIIEWKKNSVREGFVKPNNEEILAEAKTSEEVVQTLKDYKVSEGRFKLNWHKT